jgi:hypothetical protein
METMTEVPFNFQRTVNPRAGSTGLGFRTGGTTPVTPASPAVSQTNAFTTFWETTRANLGRTWLGTGAEGWESDDEVVWAMLVLDQYSTANAGEKVKAQDIIAKRQRAGSGAAGGGGPSTAQNAAGIKAELENLAGLFGLPERDWSDLSWQAASNNWNAAMIRDAVANQISMESSKREGLVKNVITKSRDVAANYLVNVGDEEALGWAKKIARGEMEEESIVASVRDRAKAQYYWLAPAIDQGVTLKEYFQPHRETIAKLMEVSAESVDFMNDPTWNKVVRYMSPDQEGVREMNLGEVEKYVRQQDGWKATSNAKTVAASAAASIGRIFGAL